LNYYTVRFNKSRGQPGRGTTEHVWRVFENDKEYLARHIQIQVPSWSEMDENGHDYNIVCHGRLLWYNDTDTAVIINE
jgi:hypothetical protein